MRRPGRKRRPDARLSPTSEVSLSPSKASICASIVTDPRSGASGNSSSASTVASVSSRAASRPQSSGATIGSSRSTRNGRQDALVAHARQQRVRVSHVVAHAQNGGRDRLRHEGLLELVEHRQVTAALPGAGRHRSTARRPFPARTRRGPRRSRRRSPVPRRPYQSPVRRAG